MNVLQGSVCSGCSLPPPWPHLPLLPIAFSTLAALSSLNTPLLPQGLCTCSSLCLEWSSYKCPHGLPFLFLFCVSMSSYQKSFPDLPASYLCLSFYTPFPSLFLVLSLSPIWKYICLVIYFWSSMPPEFKQHKFQNFVFWEGRWKSLGEWACGETQTRINKQLF